MRTCRLVVQAAGLRKARAKGRSSAAERIIPESRSCISEEGTAPVPWSGCGAQKRQAPWQGNPVSYAPPPPYPSRSPERAVRRAEGKSAPISELARVTTTKKGQAHKPPLTGGERNCHWVQNHCRTPEGKDVGKPVRLREWRRRTSGRFTTTRTGRAGQLLALGARTQSWVRRDGALPGMPTFEECRRKTTSIGEMHKRLWLATEMMALAFMGHVERRAVH
jgi:hypothetical protein